MKDKWVMWQHKNYLSLALLTNIGSFVLVALATDWMSALVLVLLGRIFFVHHCTFFINSLAHTMGSRTYSKEITAADNFFLSLLTFGEGYHNYHHAFPNDYRNGVKWYHFDPSKWIISLFQKMNMVSRLRLKDLLRVKSDLISKDLHMIKDKMEELKSYTPEIKKSIMDTFHSCANSFQERHNDLTEKLDRYKEEYFNAPKVLQKMTKREIRKLQKELEYLWKQWVRLVKDFDGIHPLHHAH